MAKKTSSKRLPASDEALAGGVDKDSSPAENHAAHETATTTGDSSPGLADASDGDRAAAAIAFLSRGAPADASVGGDATEIERQARRLAEWSGQEGLVLPESHFSGLEKYPYATAEHEVFHRPADNRAVKRTYPGTFGVTPHGKGHQTAATPLFYLHRFCLMNEVFCTGLRFEGIAFGKSLFIGQPGPQPSIVISQPWIRAADLNRPHPTQDEIARFMHSLGFEPLIGAHFGWHRLEDGIRLVDARVDNFIKSPDGVVPIDLVMQRPP